MKVFKKRNQFFYTSTSVVMIVVFSFFQISCKFKIREVTQATSSNAANPTPTPVSTFLQGRLDTGFAVATSNFDRFDQGGWEDFAMAIDMQSDGKIVVGQWSDFGGAGVDFVVSRLNVDGTLDNTFGSGAGFVQIDITGGDDTLNAIKVKPNGKIVAVGTTYSDWEMIQLNSDGSLDTNFNNAFTPGMLIQDFGGSTETANAVAVLADNSFIVAGHSDQSGIGRSTIMKVLDDGSLDPTFGTGGITELNFGYDADYINGLTIQNDGKIIVAGMADSSGTYLPAIARLDTAGTLDGSFGAITPGMGGTSETFSSVVMKNNDIYACGSSNVDGTVHSMIAKLDSSGNPDPSFDGDGFRTIIATGTANMCKSILVDVDGYLVMVGDIYANQNTFTYAGLQDAYQRIGHIAFNFLSNLFFPSAHAFVVMNTWNVYAASVKPDGTMNSAFGSTNYPGIFVQDLGYSLPDHVGGAVINSQNKIQITTRCENGTDTDACTFLVK